ncbi:hypothetical protein [Curtobacterium sp. VKM Ac-2922]|uniref:hypothetical protein n=1 Tax=Curtobacterium sp. VKM Ac-2922 TaxID=2929475 RepID=UPI001FB2D2DA|nr:hypothetical protein [Curtobacterium sp. VKM Ac-2922]MCJ1713323.1 hypothetical protein [Curtobacterium sp. VKM Ac-2922]
MSEPTSNLLDPHEPPRQPRSRAMLVLLVVVALEFAALVAATVFLLVEVLVSPASSIASGIALTVLTAIAALWLGSMLVGLWRSRSWVRSGIIVWQVLQGALAIGAFQGVFRVPSVGWALLLPALVAITLVLSKSVTAALARRVE